jgi:hypothetical protein
MSQQLTFHDIFAAAEHEKATDHIPGTTPEAIHYYRGLIEKFHAVLLVPDYEAATAIQKEADELACKLNGGNPGIKAGPDAPCHVLERATHAPEGTLPLWGQTGEFIVIVGTMQVRIKIDGIFGLGARPIPGFSTYCVEPDRPFLSDTGYQTFLGHNPQLSPGMSPDQCVIETIKVYVAREMKKRPVLLKAEYRRRFSLEP